MTNTKTAKELQSAKRLIAQKAKDFESRLTKTRNAFEQILIYNEMQELIEAEILSWSNMIDPDDSTDNHTNEDVLNMAAEHVASLTDFIQTLNNERKNLMPEAVKIQQAMINSHKLKAPVINPN